MGGYGGLWGPLGVYGDLLGPMGAYGHLWGSMGAYWGLLCFILSFRSVNEESSSQPLISSCSSSVSSPISSFGSLANFVSGNS